MLILNIITSANLILLFYLLFFRKNNALPNKILALVLINPGINFISNINVLTGNFFSFPYVYFFAQATMFGFAPFVHMYVTLLLGKKINIKFPVYYITLVGMLMVVFFAVDFSLLSETKQYQYLKGVMDGPYPIQMNIANGLFIVLQQVYFTVSLISVIQHKRKLRNVFSNFEKTKISYTSKFITLIWILNLTTIILYATQPTIHVEYIYLPIVLTVIYFFILYYAFHHHSIFTQETYADFVTENKASLDSEKPINPDIELQQLAVQLEEVFLKKELYRNPDLTIEILADTVGVSESRVSLAINQVLGRNFYDFVNEKRVEKSKVLLKELLKTSTIEYIAYEAGFNSRASFYRAFKKYTGLTPSEYQKTLVS